MLLVSFSLMKSMPLEEKEEKEDLKEEMMKEKIL
jgi:hypothetical protein